MDNNKYTQRRSILTLLIGLSVSIITACSNHRYGYTRTSNVTISLNGILRKDSLFTEGKEYCYLHLIRNQECTRCTVGALYQWKEIISIIDRNDFSYIFIIEPNPEDRKHELYEVLQKSPLNHSIIIDWNHKLISNNLWLNKKRYRMIDDYIFNEENEITKLKNPFESFNNLKIIHNFRQTVRPVSD